MSAAQNRIFAGGDLSDRFCLPLFPDRLVVFELRRILKDLCFAPRLVQPAQKPRMNIDGDLALPIGIETIGPIFRNPVRRHQRRVIADDAQVESRRVEIPVRANVMLRHVRQKLAPFDRTGDHAAFDEASLHRRRDIVDVKLDHAGQHLIEKLLPRATPLTGVRSTLIFGYF